MWEAFGTMLELFGWAFLMFHPESQIPGFALVAIGTFTYLIRAWNRDALLITKIIHSLIPISMALIITWKPIKDHWNTPHLAPSTPSTANNPIQTTVPKKQKEHPMAFKRKQQIKMISDLYYEGTIIRNDCIKMDEDDGNRAVEWAHKTADFLAGIDKFYVARFGGAPPLDERPLTIFDKSIPPSNSRLWHWIDVRLKVLEDVRNELNEKK
jgi:hypothetical protein